MDEKLNEFQRNSIDFPPRCPRQTNLCTPLVCLRPEKEKPEQI